VLPAICTEERITLGAELEDGTVIKGQNTISHPSSSNTSGSGSSGGSGDSSGSNGALRGAKAANS
jgi:hypothetical protein